VSATQIATLHTSAGDIRVQLYGNHAPKTVKNFVELAEGSREWTHPETRAKTTDRLYDGTVFHRVIANFMIQGGDPLGRGTGGPGYRFADEFHPELSVAPTRHLTGKHTIFGEVADADSRAVVDAIATAATGPGDRPAHDVVINTVTVEPAEE